jgi:dCMP deaminase
LFVEKWDDRYLKLALHVASWSKDPSTQVGCVIIDEKGRPVSFGFNGFARGCDDSPERYANRDLKLTLTIHAEINAVLAAGRHLDNCTVYITHPPCLQCLVKLKQSFVSKIVCYDGGEDFSKRWNPQDSVKMAEELGIKLIIIKS